MKIALLILAGLAVVGLVIYFLAFPPNTFITLSRPGGGSITFSRTSISFDAAPDHYPTNGFDHIEPYVARFLVPSHKFKSLGISTPDGKRALSLRARDGKAEVFLSVEWRQEPEREAAIRSFFKSIGIAPSMDYLAANGGVQGSTRCLEYPIKGSASEVTALTQRILRELCGVTPTEALDIDYKDK